MDERSQKKASALRSPAVANNLAAMGTGASKTNGASISPKERMVIERKLDELGSKIDKLTEQLKNLQAPPQDQKIIVESANGAEPGKKEDTAQQAKPQDVIYVRKSSDFSFYS
jgi:hypothetical protein